MCYFITVFHPIQVFCPYAYGLPHNYVYRQSICILAAHMYMGCPYVYRFMYGPAHTDIMGNSCFARMRMSACMCISMSDHAYIATAIT